MALALTALSVVLSSAEESWQVLRWDVGDGLPQGSVADIVQTDDGYLWFATFGGLARFDGIHFHTVEVAEHPQLRSNRIMSLLLAQDDTLWIGTQDAGVIHEAEGRYTPMNGGWDPLEPVVDLAEYPRDRIWAATSERLLVFEDDDWAEWPPDGPRLKATSLLVSASGDLWIATQSGLLRYDGERLHTIETPVDKALGRMTEDADGRLWVASEHGLYVLPTPDADRLEQRLTDPIYDVLPDGERLWVGITIDEVRRYHVTGAGELEFDPPFLTGRAGYGVAPPTKVNSMLIDRQGNRWMGSRGEGLARLRPSAVRVETRDSDHRPQALTTDVGGLWFAGHHGRLFRLDRQGIRPGGELFEGEVPLGIMDFLRERDGSLWLATESGLWRQLGSSFVRVTPPLSCTTVHRDRAGRIWLGTTEGLWYDAGDHWEPWPLPEPLGGFPVVKIGDHPDGSLWFQHPLGVVRMDDSGARLLTPTEDGIPTGTIRAIHADDAGFLWLGSYGGGLARIEGDVVIQFTTEHGLPENIVSGIATDDHYLWTYGNVGITRFDRDQLDREAREDPKDRRVRPRFYGPQEGVSEGSGPRGLEIDPHGRVWVSTIRGLVSVDPADALPLETEPPSAEFESLLVDGHEHPLRDVRIAAGYDRVEIVYTGLESARPTTLEFEHQLVGYDELPIPAGHRRSAFYTRPPPGRYELRVWAIDDNGKKSSEPAVLHLAFQPRLYQTHEFYGGISALALLAVFGGVRWSRRRRDRHRREEQERELRQAQAQRLEALGTLAGGVAHDFNNLLMAITGYTEMVLLGLPAESQSARQLQYVLGAAKRAAELIAKILMFSRRSEAPRVPARIEALLDETLALVRPTLSSSVQLEVDVLASGAYVEAHVASLEQVLVNLVTNAAQALGEGGGVIRITIDRDALDELRAGALGLAPGDYVRIRVEDDGEGMDAETLERVFEPFFTTKPLGKGTGMGLAVVHGLVQSHDGTIQAASEPGVGSTFEVLLPTIEPPPTHASTASDPRGGDETILLVEDDPELLRLFSRRLGMLGYEVVPCGAPEAALEVFQTRPQEFDLLLTDYDMPKLNGLQLAAVVTGRRADLPVVLVTGLGPDIDAEQAGRHGVRRVLAKPVPGDLLARTLREVLDAPA